MHTGMWMLTAQLLSAALPSPTRTDVVTSAGCREGWVLGQRNLVKTGTRHEPSRMLQPWMFPEASRL